jgi:hypothetical protein
LARNSSVALTATHSMNFVTRPFGAIFVGKYLRADAHRAIVAACVFALAAEPVEPGPPAVRFVVRLTV